MRHIEDGNEFEFSCANPACNVKKTLQAGSYEEAIDQLMQLGWGASFDLNLNTHLTFCCDECFNKYYENR